MTVLMYALEAWIGFPSTLRKQLAAIAMGILASPEKTHIYAMEDATANVGATLFANPTSIPYKISEIRYHLYIQHSQKPEFKTPNP